MCTTSDTILFLSKLLPTQHIERSKYNEGRADKVVANRGYWNVWYPLSTLDLGVTQTVLVSTG